MCVYLRRCLLNKIVNIALNCSLEHEEVLWPICVISIKYSKKFALGGGMTIKHIRSVGKRVYLNFISFQLRRV